MTSAGSTAGLRSRPANVTGSDGGTSQTHPRGLAPPSDSGHVRRFATPSNRLLDWSSGRKSS